ncbi:DNA-binding protein [Dechloromonas hortensis]|uniref:DNA-binding protein n=1 Tax=Dechloromonas hortensis TaxID=337779 RepID=UPI001290A524|nr:DNA-binding protein [Dechloromonas hortensis]
MARTTNITFGQVAQIADAMKAAGTRPTARAVRERIGSGSMGTIHKLLQQWTGKASEADEDQSPELPSSIASALMDFVSTQVAEACEPLNEELAAAREAADALAEDNERQTIAYQEQGRDLIASLENLAAARANLEQTKSVLADHESEVFKLRQQVSDLLRELDRSQRQTEMFASYQPELAQAKTALASSEAARIEAERSAAVLSAQLVAKSEKADELEARLKTAETLVSAKDGELKQANNHYQACAARLEAAAREVESLRKKPASTKIVTPKKTATVKKTDGNS